MRRLRKALGCLGRGWGAAVRFLTVLPWGKWEHATPEDLGCAAVLFPWAGALVGSVVAGVLWGVPRTGGALPVAAALALVAWVALTGGLHLDGLMDAADGLGGGQTPERRLEIMRDERVGAFGVLAGGLVLLVKFAALQQAAAADVVLAAVLGRWVLTAAMAAFPYARPSGLGKLWFDRVGWPELLAASLGAALVVALAGSPRGWWLWGGVVVVLWGAGRWVLRRIPGLTGDVYGALAELTEAFVLLGMTWGGR